METFANIGNIIAAFDQHQAFQAKLELFRGWDEAARFIKDNLAISAEDKSEAQSTESRLRGNELFKKGAFRAALGSKRQFFNINFTNEEKHTLLYYCNLHHVKKTTHGIRRVHRSSSTGLPSLRFPQVAM